MSSPAASARPTRFTTALSTPADTAAAPGTTAFASSSAAHREQANVVARQRKKAPDAGADGHRPTVSTWATKLYEVTDDTTDPPDRMAAVLEGATRVMEINGREADDTTRGDEPAIAGYRPHTDAKADTAADSLHAGQSTSKNEEAKETMSVPSPSAPSSERARSAEETGDTAPNDHSEDYQHSVVDAGSSTGPSAPDEDQQKAGLSHTAHFSMSQAPDRKIAWRCGVCGYYVLAMDQNGHPLPVALSAFGNPLPLRCPRCQLEHTAWEQGVPFDPHGDHVNVRSKLSNNYVVADDRAGEMTARQGKEATQRSPTLAAATARYEKVFPTNSTSLLRHSLLSSLAETHPDGSAKGTPQQQQRLLRNAATTPDGKAAGNRMNALNRLGLGVNGDGEFGVLSSLPRTTPSRSMAYYCGLCNRRLLRVDAQGELVPMDCDDDGQVLPIVCPGCGECHSNWMVKPFAVQQNVAPVGKRLY